MITLPLSERAILLVVTVIGMAMCSAGIGQVAARGDWLHPLSIVGYAFGALILAIVGAALIGLKLPWIESPRAALVAVIVLSMAKIVFTQLHRALS
jgi:hypothetical protein